MTTTRYDKISHAVYVDGCRTPFVKAFGPFRKYSAIDMAVGVVDRLIEKVKIDPSKIDEIVFSSVLLDPRTPNPGRELVFKSKYLKKTTSAHFATNNCISGIVGINMLVEAIASKRISCGIAVGVESMSNPTLTYKRDVEKAWLRMAKPSTWKSKIKDALKVFWPSNIPPERPSVKEPSTGLSMGEHCELMAKEWEISREDQDTLACRSQVHASIAQNSHKFDDEIVSFGGVDRDLTVRAKTSMDRLIRLPSVFDKSELGTITAGNSSPLTDGASAVLIMSESFAEQMGLKPKARIGESLSTRILFSAINPVDGLLMAPATAVPKLLNKSCLTVDQISRWEIHEAFAAQVLCNLKAWKQGWYKYQIAPIGEVPVENININGGSIALGHPFAATGGRLLMTLANGLESGKMGVISICAAGGMAAAMSIQGY